MSSLAVSMAESRPHTLRLEEAELNSWLRQALLVAAEPEATGGSSARDGSNLRRLQIGLDQDRLQIYLVFDFHGRDLSLMMEARPRVREGRLGFEASAGRLGSLPIPRPALSRALDRIFQSPENREQLSLPVEISGVEVRDGQLLVSYQPLSEKNLVESSPPSAP